jgi:hypothetical protein
LRTPADPDARTVRLAGSDTDELSRNLDDPRSVAGRRGMLHLGASKFWSPRDGVVVSAR